MHENIRKILWPLKILCIIFFIGILGYIFIEGYSLIDAFYMTTISLSTVGYGEVAELSDKGKLFTSVLILSGITVLVYALGNLTKFFIEGEMTNFIKGVKMKKEISSLKDHYILCGAGRTGMKIYNEFRDRNIPCVIIEKDENLIEHLKKIYGETIYYVNGDAALDETLILAGVKNAKVIMSVVSTDAENLFITLTAKDLNSKIKVVTRSIETSSNPKLKRAGADFIISPFNIAADRIVATATQNNLVSFVDIVSKKNKIEDLKFELVEIVKNSSLENHTLKTAKIPQKTNLIVIGHEVNGELHINPMSSETLLAGDKILVLGTEEQLLKIQDLASA